MKVININGEPATGKSTLVKRWMERRMWTQAVEVRAGVPRLEYAYNSKENIVVLGSYKPGETFGGTDRLGMSVQPVVQEWLDKNRHSYDVVVWEGDRLSNAKMFNWLLVQGFDVKFLFLRANSATLKARHKERGDAQTEPFLRSRKTKSNRLYETFSEHSIALYNETEAALLENEAMLEALVRK